jgi:hypothetical protein
MQDYKAYADNSGKLKIHTSHLFPVKGQLTSHRNKGGLLREAKPHVANLSVLFP